MFHCSGNDVSLNSSKCHEMKCRAFADSIFYSWTSGMVSLDSTQKKGKLTKKAAFQILFRQFESKAS